MTRRRKWLIDSLKLLVAAALLTYLFREESTRVNTLDALRVATTSGWPFLIGGLATFFCCLLLGVVRWWLILRSSGINLPLRQTTALLFIGHFFNAMMPGALGGDVIKAFYVTRIAGTRKTEAVTTVFLDRIIGLLALIGLVAVMMVLNREAYTSNETLNNLFVGLIPFLITGPVLLLIGLFTNLFDIPFLDKLSKRSTFVGTLRRAYEVFYGVCRNPVLAFQTLSLSLAGHVLGVVMFYMAGRALGTTLSFKTFLTFGPLVNAIASIPSTPGGLGVRENAAEIIYGACGLGSAAAISISILTYAFIIFWSAVGGIVYVLYSADTRAALKKELAAVKENAQSDTAPSAPQDDKPAATR